jgi:hypothetical protein
LIELNGDIRYSMIILEDINIPFSITHTTGQKEVNEDREYLKNTVN